jgi:hypothetical protein
MLPVKRISLFALGPESNLSYFAIMQGFGGSIRIASERFKTVS